MSASEFGGLRLGGANPGRQGQVVSGPPDLPFWEDVLWLRELAAAKPALAAVNPYAATRLLGRDPAATPARRRYHIALLRRFNGNRTLADVAGMKKAIAAEAKKSPDDWAAPGWGGPYAALQADQWAAYFEQNLEKNAAVLGAYRNRPLGAARWAKASGRWRPQAPAMLAFLRDGVLDPTALANRVGRFYNTKPPAPDYGQWSDLTDPAFWQAVQTGR